MLLVTSLRRDGHRVVAVERGGDTKAFSAAQAEHVPVVVGDALDLSVLRAARVQNASYVVCLLSSTEDNVAVALAARRLLAESPTASPDPILLVYARPYGYVSTLRDIHFGRLRAAGSLLESMDFINVEENVAQQLLRRWKLKVQDGQRGLGNGSDVVVPDTLVLLGLSDITEALLVEISRRVVGTKISPPARTVLLGPDPMGWLQTLLWRHPGLNCLGTVEATVACTPIEQVKQASEELCTSPGRVLVVCVLPGAAGTEVTQHQLAEKGVLYPSHSSLIVALCAPGAGSIAEFVADDSFLGIDSLVDGMDAESVLTHRYEDLARSIHDFYIEQRIADGSYDPTAPQIVPWDGLAPTYKESNRDQARSILQALGAAGLTVRRLGTAASNTTSGPKSLSISLVEDLARGEHERWCIDRRRDGWKHGSVRDNEHRIHPDLLEWAQLSEDVREKDRQMVRNWSSLLAREGYEIVETPRGEGEKESVV
jgi:hypothetical protein